MLLKTRAAVAAAVTAARGAGRTVALVPTMGYLHEGHLSLVDLARGRADLVIVSVFVNPLQFGPTEDLDRYPRDLERDISLASARGADIIFAPPDVEMYPAGEPAVRVVPGPLGARLCGAFRPGHFEGVLTVVAKLFNIVRPDVAVFGQKDYQQAALIRRMVVDLDFGITVETAPIVREPDGLALSSRNVYLRGQARSRAVRLSRALACVLDAWRGGETDAARLTAFARETLVQGGGVEPQYVELVSPDDLTAVERAREGDVLAVAAHVAGTRLIDNVILQPE